MPQTTQTDQKGRFTIRDLCKGVTLISVIHGKIIVSGGCLADGSLDEPRLKLRSHSSYLAPIGSKA